MDFVITLEREVAISQWYYLRDKGGYLTDALFFDHLLEHEQICQAQSQPPGKIALETTSVRHSQFQGIQHTKTLDCSTVYSDGGEAGHDRLREGAHAADEESRFPGEGVEQAAEDVCDVAITSSAYVDSPEIGNNEELTKIKTRKARKKKKAKRAYTVESCLICRDQKFCDFDDFRQHMHEKHTGPDLYQDSDFPCPICKNKYATKKHVLQHARKYHYNISRFETCDECGKRFSSKYLLENHMGIHSGERTKCPFCDKTFIGQISVEGHISAIHQKPDAAALTCDICFRVLSSLKCLRYHKQTHAESRVICDVCEKPLATEKSLRKHKKTIHGGQSFDCETCGKKYTSKYSLEDHERIHNGGLFSCSQCDKGFMTKQKLQRHMVSVHEQERPNVCQICGNSFKYESTLVAHLNKHNGTQYNCDLCQAKFTSKESLRNHKRRHNEPRGAFPCDYCGKNYPTPTSLKYHVHEYHNADKEKNRVNCDTCSKSFRNKSRLRIHQRVHTNERPYHCKVCDKRFTAHSSLDQHKRIHTGEKPFVCDICGDTFRQSASLYTHQKLLHKEAKLGTKPDYAAEQPVGELVVIDNGYSLITVQQEVS